MQLPRTDRTRLVGKCWRLAAPALPISLIRRALTPFNGEDDGPTKTLQTFLTAYRAHLCAGSGRFTRQ